MPNFRSHVARHHVGLVALLLVLTGGTAYAAAAIPKSSVGSKQVKDNSLKGKDLKDSGLTGADLADGSVAGADVANGSVAGADLAPDAVDGGRIKDGSVGSADLAPGTVPQLLTATKSAAVDGQWRPYRVVAGLGSVEFICSSATTAGVRFVAEGGGAVVYGYVESAAMDGDEVVHQDQQAGNAWIVQTSVTAAVAAGRVVVHSATQSLDVDVRVSHEDGNCVINGTSTLSPNPSGLPL